MADTIKSSNELKLEATFYDNDTRTIPIDNPIDDLTAAKVIAAAEVLKAKKAIIGDKGSADFVGFKSAKTIKKTTTNLDLR